MTPQELKNSILQLAVQGKLVEQRPEEGTAEELYRQIQEEKRRLVKEGKIKKEKPLPEIADDEKPFEIPGSWKWVRLIDLCKSITDGDHQPPPQVLNGIPFLVISNVSSGMIDFSNTRYVPNNYFRALSSERIAKQGDILFTVTGSYGIPIKVDCSQEFCFQRHIALLKLLIIWDYIYYLLKSPIIQSQCDAVATGTAQKTVGLKSLREMILPLPPLAEQKRIVAKIEELLPYIDRYEQAWNRLEALNKRFPEDMKKSLLQYAIEGKLVEQRPEEGTAEELYRQIQEEKKRLIKEGKIKKEKPLPEITEGEKPFDIPESWKWVRIGQIFGLQAGKNVTAADIYSQESTEHNYRCYGGNGIRGFVSTYNRDGCFALIGRQGALCGNINFAKGQFYATEHAVVVDHYGLTDVKWSGWFLRALNLNQYATATAQPGLAVANIVKILIPLPPLAEQKRIVAKLEELLPLCERLK